MNSLDIYPNSLLDKKKYNNAKIILLILRFRAGAVGRTRAPFGRRPRPDGRAAKQVVRCATQARAPLHVPSLAHGCDELGARAGVRT